MIDNRGASGGFNKNLKSSSYKKYLAFTLFVLVLFFLFSGGFGLVSFLDKNSIKEVNNFCGDNTFYNSCSTTLPYFCENGKLIEKSSVCGCTQGFVKKDEGCFSTYQTDPRWIRLEYTLNGENGYIDFTVYKGLEDYISKIPRSISYSSSSDFSRRDFILKEINDEEQREFLLPLVIKIENITNNKEDQMRIAISLVQNIPFGYSNKSYFFGSARVNYSRYPYDVLYDQEGVCSEKTYLLAFLLKEMGYGVSSFYYQKENHEALGLRCPIQESLDRSEYCFVETTGPSIITDNKINYVGVGRLTSKPEMYVLNNGKSIPANLWEYVDADKLIRIRNIIEKTGLIGPIQKKILEKMKIKYGLAEQYYG